MPGMLPVNIVDFGADPEGIQDSTKAIRDAINRVKEDSNGHGGVVQIPPGTFLIKETIEIDHFVVLSGIGWATPTFGYVPNDRVIPGSWFRIRDQITAFRVKGRGNANSTEGRGVCFRSLAIRHDQPDAPGAGTFVPRDYPFAFSIHTDDVVFDNVMMLNPTRGIYFGAGGDGGVVGRLYINRLLGQPLRIGIEVDDTLDSVRINDVHFWPFWNIDEGVKRFLLGGDGTVTAFKLFRCDGAQMTNIFAYGYQHGIEVLESAAGVPTALMISNLYLDACGIGVPVACSNSSVHIANAKIQGAGVEKIAPEFQGKWGVIMKGGRQNRLDLANVDLSNFRNSCVRADNGWIHAENLRIDGWNWARENFYGVEAREEGEIRLGRGFVFGASPGSIGPVGGNVITDV